MADASGVDAIRYALDGLRDSHAAIKSAFQAFEEQDLIKENASLREMAERLSAQLRESKIETEELLQAHEELVADFKHELSSKRLTLLGLSERQHQAYLSAGLEREREQIDALYAGLRDSMDDLSAELRVLDADEREPLFAELALLRGRIVGQAERARARREAAWRDAASRQSDELSGMKNSPIEDAALNTARKFFAWEAFWGLKIISAVGALLLLLGVFTFGRYLYVSMGPVLQCAAIFILGLALIGAGEALHRKKWRSGFTLALTASGSGILFLGAALGVMTLGVLPEWVALGICAGVSLLTFAASLRYNSQLIAVCALVGGYLPMFALRGDYVFFGAFYFMILSLLALLIATRKRWQATRFIGLGAGLIAEQIMMNVSMGKLTSMSVIAMTGVAIAVGFMAYLVIPVFGAWFTRARIRAADIALLSCNVFFHYLWGLLWGAEYARAAIRGWRDHTGMIAALVTAFFAVCCIVMALVAERQEHSGVPKSEAGSLRALFFITSVTFSGLIVLFALDSAWFSAGWLIQASGLALYGTLKNRRRFNIAGAIIGAICLFAFFTVNVSNLSDPLFAWKYLAITLAANVVSIAALKRKPARRDVRRCMDAFRCAAAINTWGYAVYALHTPLMPALTRALEAGAQSFAALLSITFGFILAFLLPRIRRVYNYGLHIAAVAIGAIGTVWLLRFNAGAQGLTGGNMAMSAVVFALYVIVNIAGVGWINDLLRFLGGLRKLPFRWYPLLVSGFAVLLAAQNLIVQFSLKASSLILTLLFGITALCWVAYGFVKRNGATRVGGLAMAFFAVIKLFVLDLYGLGTTWRIISYFTAGVVLLAISFTYQWFSKRREAGEKAEGA